MRIILLVSLLLSMVQLQAQERKEPAVKITAEKENAPFLLVDSLPSELNCLLLGADKIERVDVYKGEEALKRFGDKAKNGAIIIKTKPGTRLFRIKDILDANQISESDRRLRICINKILIKDPQLIIAGSNEIHGVEVVSGRHTDDLKQAYSGEKYINISAVNVK